MDYALLLSVSILLAAPFLSRLVRDIPPVKSGLDGFVMVTVIGLITLTLLPEALMQGGYISLLIAIAGFSLPWMSEIVFHRSEAMTHRVILLVSALAIVVHAASDGAILAFAHQSSGGSFVAVGILLHRLGEAITIWWLLKPIFSSRGGFAILAMLALLTLVGYFIVLFAEDWYNFPLVGYWQAFAAGSLFHVVMHPLAEHHDHAAQKQMEQAHRVGTLTGVAFVTMLVISHYINSLNGGIASHHDHDGLHHSTVYLAHAALLVAPINLLILAACVLFRRLSDSSFRRAYPAIKALTPWTFVAWLAASIVLALIPDFEIPSLKGNVIAVSLWIALVAAVLVQSGARQFFSTLLPQLKGHQHHSH